MLLNLYTGPVPLRKYIPEPAANPDTGEIVVPINMAPILYTGDANYSAKTRFDRMTKYFGDKRVNAVATFQVPHQSSKHYWKKGLAPLISQRIEVGMFGNQNTVCKPVTPGWRATVEKLKISLLEIYSDCFIFFTLVCCSFWPFEMS